VSETLHQQATSVAALLAAHQSATSDVAPLLARLEGATSWSSAHLREEYISSSGGRPPPPDFERWVAFARRRQCALPAVAYRGMADDLAPFRVWTAEQFRAAVERASQPPGPYYGWLVRVHNGRMSNCYDKTLQLLCRWLAPVVRELPNMTFVWNTRDEARILARSNGSGGFNPHKKRRWLEKELLPACTPNAAWRLRRIESTHGYLHSPHPHIVSRALLPVISSMRIGGACCGQVKSS
jgi:hypothetical protein